MVTFQTLASVLNCQKAIVQAIDAARLAVLQARSDQTDEPTLHFLSETVRLLQIQANELGMLYSELSEASSTI